MKTFRFFSNVQVELSRAVSKLKNLKNPQLEAEILLSKILGTSRIRLKTHPNHKISFFSSIRFRRVVKLRQKRVPIAQILKFKTFSDLKILTNRSVLIPRDETEILIHHISVESRDFSPNSILDLGTGSGCISIAVARNFPNAKIHAVDCSRSALRLARRNFHIHRLKAEICRSDLLEKIENNTEFDVIIANLPYIPESDFGKCDPEISHEPKIAIFSEGDGLHLIRRLANELREKKIKFRELWLEFRPKQSAEIREIFKAKTQKIKFFKDVAGNIFFAKISLKNALMR